LKAKSKVVTPVSMARPGRGLQIAIPLLAIVGMAISGYLTYLHYATVSAVCLPFMECDVVLSSPYSVMWGVPLSLFGMVVYAFITGLGIWQLRAKNEGKSLAALLIYVMALSGIIFTVYLYYLEIFVIHDF
jgi:uncharacterized membrane protein